jgi:hypothetical protein
MKFKKIVGFGDSWIWGDELLDPNLQSHPHAHPVLLENTGYRESHCFLGQLGTHYDVPTENFGIAGGSLTSTIWNYLWWLDHEILDPTECLVLVGLTASNRKTFYNPNHRSYGNDPDWNRYVHSAWVHFDSCYSQDWMEAVKKLTVLSDCIEQDILNYKQTVMFFEGQSALRSSGLLQFCTINPPVRLESKSLLWPDRSLVTLINQRPDPKQYLAKQGHPNEKGHQLIAENLIPLIDSCIIKG